MTTTLNRNVYRLHGAIAWCIVLGIAVISGCDNRTDDGAAATSDAKPDPGRKKFVTIGTAPAGGAFAPVGNAIANVVRANKGELNWEVKPESTKGTQENIRRLAAGELEFGMANAAISYFAVNGEGAWKKPFAVRAVATLAPNVGIFVTTESTGIQTIADLKGKRVVLGPAGAGFDYFLKPLLSAHGVSYDDLSVLNGNYIAAVDMLCDGRADAAFMGGAIPIPAVVQLCATQDVVFVKFADDAVEKLKDYPFYFAVPVKADTYSDLKTDLTGINVGSMQLITHENVDDDVVYNFIKTLYENRGQLVEKHPAGKALNPENAVRDTGTPFHPGAVKFYKEAGIWPTE
jgi:TRAP transporter TAXI family solute receptor